MSKQFTFEAIGTHFWIEIFDEITDSELEATKGRLELLSSEFNQAYSRFLPDSLISVLNRERELSHASPECIEILNLGKQFYQATDGAFNFLSGHILEARGYDANYSFKATEGADTAVRCNPLTNLTITQENITLTCGNVDIGGYGKGYLIDKLAVALVEHGITYFLINGGGDMYASSNFGEPVVIYLEHPTETTKYLIETSLCNQGFAASSPFKRQWKDGERTYTHIVTDGDVPTIASFVKAKTATEADAFATASLLLSETTLLKIAQTDDVAFARFSPITNQFWRTNNFDTV